MDNEVAKPALPPTAAEDQVRVPFTRSQYPVPFHAVRTQFLGNIATSAMQSAPMETVTALWAAPFRCSKAWTPPTTGITLSDTVS